MRKLAGVFLIVAVPIATVLGGLLLLSSQHQKVMAEIEANDLSSVASDLMSPKELAKQRAAASKRKKKTGAAKRGTRQRLLGYGLFGAALPLLLSGGLSLLGRRRSLVVVLSGLGLVAFGATLLLEPAHALPIAGTSLSLLGTVLAALSKRATWKARAEPAA